MPLLRAVKGAAALAEALRQRADEGRVFAVPDVIMQLTGHAVRFELQQHRVQRRNADTGGQQHNALRGLQRKQVARGRDAQRLARAQRLVDIARSAARFTIPRDADQIALRAGRGAGQRVLTRHPIRQMEIDMRPWPPRGQRLPASGDQPDGEAGIALAPHSVNDHLQQFTHFRLRLYEEKVAKAHLLQPATIGNRAAVGGNMRLKG